MKKVRTWLSAVLLTITSIAYFVVLSARAREKPAPVLVLSENNITPRERKDVLRLLPLAITWNARWLEPLECDGNGVSDEDAVAATSGKTVRVVLDVGKDQIRAVISDLHVTIWFRRLNGARAFSFEQFCEASYEDWKSNYLARIRNSQFSDPTVQIEEHRVELPVMRYDILRSEVSESEKRLRQRLRQEILNQAAEDLTFTCERGRVTELWIPEFDSRDPEIIVGVKERPGWSTDRGWSIAFFHIGAGTNGQPIITSSQRLQEREIDGIYYFFGKLAFNGFTVERVECRR